MPVLQQFKQAGVSSNVRSGPGATDRVSGLGMRLTFVRVWQVWAGVLFTNTMTDDEVRVLIDMRGFEGGNKCIRNLGTSLVCFID